MTDKLKIETRDLEVGSSMTPQVAILIYLTSPVNENSLFQ